MKGSRGQRLGQRRPSRRWLVLFALIALVILAGKTCTAVTGRTNPIDTAVTHITTPLVGVLQGIGRGFQLIFKIPSALRDNANLVSETDLLERRVAELSHLQTEYEQLQELLAVRPPPQFHPVTARVIARPYDLWLESVWINAGSRDGVRKGNLVANDKGVIGIVKRVETGSCSVTLLSSPDLALGAVTEGLRIEGVIHGRDACTAKLDLVPANSPVSIGDKLFTLGEETYPGGENNRPRGMYIGMVLRVVDSGGYQDITVEPAAGMNRLDWVVVYTK